MRKAHIPALMLLPKIVLGQYACGVGLAKLAVDLASVPLPCTIGAVGQHGFDACGAEQPCTFFQQLRRPLCPWSPTPPYEVPNHWLASVLVEGVSSHDMPTGHLATFPISISWRRSNCWKVAVRLPFEILSRSRCARRKQLGYVAISSSTARGSRPSVVAEHPPRR